MDSNDRPDAHLPAVPPRFAAPRPALIAQVQAGQGADDAAQAGTNLFKAACRAIVRNWWQILLLWGVGTAGLCYVITTRVVPKYESVSILKADPTTGGIIDRSNAGESLEPFMKTQVQLILSPNVLSTVLSNAQIQSQPSLRDSPDPEATLRTLVKVDIVPHSYLLQVSMVSPSAVEAATIVNAVVKSYLDAAKDWGDGVNRLQIKALESYHRELQAQVDEKQQAWIALVKKTNVHMEFDGSAGEKGGNNLPVPRLNQVTRGQYEGIRDEVLRVELDLSKAEALLALREQEAARAGPGQAQAGPAAEGPGADVVEMMVRSDPEVLTMARDLKRAKDKYDRVRGLTRNPSDPSVLDARKKWAALNDEYAQLFRRKSEMLQARRDPQTGAVSELAAGTTLQAARERVATLRAAKESYEKMLGKLEVSNGQEGTDLVRIALVQDALAGLKRMQEAVRTRLEELKFDSKRAARVSQVSAARANLIPISDNRKKFLLVSPLAVLVLVIGFFAALEVKIGRVSDLDDFAKVVPTEVFAMPPLPGPRLDPGQRGARERESQLLQFLQSLDHLRVALSESPSGTASGRCLAITSATESEGKTTLAAQLAACCAKAGVATLLVDGDLRRCTLSRMLNEANTKGLSDALQGEILEADAIVPVADAGFHMLPAGTVGRDPSWLLKGQALGRLLTAYRQQFDMIIIDTPPVLPVPDALTVGRWTDGVVLATRYDFSRMALVLKARRRLNSAGIPIAKTVVNGVKTSRFYYGYKYSGYYGYGSYAAYAPYESHHPQDEPSGQPTTA